MRLQLGRVDRWPRWVKGLLPLWVTFLLWWSVSWLFAWSHVIPHPASAARQSGESLVIALGSYLAWKYLIIVLLALHLLNSYIYFGKHPFWKYVDGTGRRLLLPLQKIPLRVGKADFTPVVGIALVFLFADCIQNGLKLFPRIGENGHPLPPVIDIPGLADIYRWLSL